MRFCCAKAHLPTKEAPPLPSAWLSQAHAHFGWTACTAAPPSEGPSSPHRLATLKPHDRRLSRRADFDRVFQSGRHNGGKLLAVRSVRNEEGVTRFGFAIPKRVGKAVVRNRVRRRLREILRSFPLIEGYDVVISVRPESATASFWTLKTELLKLMLRARVVAGPDSQPGQP